MRRFYLLCIVIGSMSSCLTGNSDAHLRLLAGASEVENNILRFEEHVVELNADVGAPRTILLPGRGDLFAKYEQIVARRLKVDLAAVYPSKKLRAADRTYLLFATQNGQMTLNVIRVSNVDRDGSYVRLEGLVYVLNEQGSVIEVLGTEY